MEEEGRVERFLNARDKEDFGAIAPTTAPSIRLSIITVCYNAVACIETCVRSVVNQTYEDLEFIVVDGSSSDGTLEVLNRYRSHISTLISEPDSGIFVAMNKGLSLATGDFIFFLNADDYFVDRKVVRDVIESIAAYPAGDVYYGSIEVRGEDGTKAVHEPSPPEKAAVSMICGCLPHQATFARRYVFERTGPFDESYRYHADYDWFLKIIADPQIKLVRFNRVVASFRIGGRSSQLSDGQPEVYRIQNACSLYQSEEWSRRRIAEFQKHLLMVRLENAELRAQSRKVASSSWHPIALLLTKKLPYLLNAGARPFSPPKVARALRNKTFWMQKNEKRNSLVKIRVKRFRRRGF